MESPRRAPETSLGLSTGPFLGSLLAIKMSPFPIFSNSNHSRLSIQYHSYSIFFVHVSLFVDLVSLLTTLNSTSVLPICMSNQVSELRVTELVHLPPCPICELIWEPLNAHTFLEHHRRNSKSPVFHNSISKLVPTVPPPHCSARTWL